MMVHDSAAAPSQSGSGLLYIGGITPFSTVDWPGKLACVAFLAGCPWRCPYCQNHILQSRDAATLGAENLFSFLETRRRLLDGVVFSGGEPLAQPGVIAAVNVHWRPPGNVEIFSTDSRGFAFALCP